MDKIREASDARELAARIRKHEFRATPDGTEIVGHVMTPDEARAEIERLDREADSAEAVAKGLADQLASARDEIKRLRVALERVVDHAEDWHEHYCEMWGERRKEQQDAILGDIVNARALLARESTEPAEERGPEVGALLWMAERLMGSSVAMTMRGWLAEYRATGKLMVRDADGTVKDSLTVASKERQ